MPRYSEQFKGDAVALYESNGDFSLTSLHEDHAR